VKTRHLGRATWPTRCGAIIAAFVLSVFGEPQRLLAAEAPEYGGRCAVSMARGRSVPTDCAVRWQSDDGRTFCFGSDAARSEFVGQAPFLTIKADEFAALGDVGRTAKQMAYHRSRDVKAFLRERIEANAAAHGGTFSIVDPVTRERLELEFEEIQMMRALHGYGFFPDAVFHVADEPERKYWIDFWIRPLSSEALELFETRIYKAPRASGDGWQLVTRQPPPWWWIPASEHPGETETKRGWEIMSAIEAHVLEARTANGVFVLEDSLTGETVELEYIGIHQPVRRLAGDGRFFACTDFRAEGSEDRYYDIDFWLNDDSGDIEVGEVRIHKVPKEIDGQWVQVPKYDFEELEFEIVP